MQKRIEEFIKVATERDADPAMYQLYQQLVGLCAEDDRKKIHVAWNTLTTIKELAKWDEDFLEETINPSPATVTEPPFASNLQRGILSAGGTGQQNANNQYVSLTQAANTHAQAQAANRHMNDYYNQLHMGTIGVEKPASYYDSIKTALGL